MQTEDRWMGALCRVASLHEMREVFERWTSDLIAGEFEAAGMWSEPEMVRHVTVSRAKLNDNVDGLTRRLQCLWYGDGLAGGGLQVESSQQVCTSVST